jgi:hypothetical protein
MISGFHPPGIGNNFTGLAEGSRYFGREVPVRLTLDRWHEDFQVIAKQAKVLPALCRAIMERFFLHVETLYVRCYAGRNEPVFNWKIERELFFALEDPFWEMPYPRSDSKYFPARTRFVYFVHSYLWTFSTGAIVRSSRQDCSCLEA